MAEPGKDPRRKIAWRVALAYVAGAAAWILITDLLLDELPLDMQSHTEISVLKGTLFVLVTGALLYGALLRLIPPIEQQVLEQHLDLLSRYANDIILLIDPSSRIVEANDRAVERYGYPREKLLTMSVEDFRLPEERSDVADRIAAVQREGNQTYEARHLSASGEVFPVEISARRVSAGGADYIQAIIRDISERKRAEAALVESEARFRALMEQSVAAAYMIQDGRVAYVNPRMRELFGYGADERFDPDPLAHVAMPDRAMVVNQMTRRLQGERHATYAFTATRRDGSEFRFGISAQAASYLGKPVIIAFGQDITEKESAEKALRASRELLGSVVEHTPARVFWKDLELRFLGCNSAVARDAGMTSPDELIGKTDFDMPWRDQAAMYQADDRRVIDSGIPKLGIEEPQTTPDGRVIWLRTSKVPLHDSAGKAIGVLGIYEDVTPQREANLALRHANRALRTLSAGNEALVRADDESSLLRDMCRVIVELGGYRVALVAFADRVGAPVRLLASHGIARADVAGMEVAWATPAGNRTTVGNAIRTGELQLARGIEFDPAFDAQRGLMEKLRLASIIGLPLRPKGDGPAIGALSIGSGYADAFDAGELDLLRELANDLAFGIETIRARVAGGIAARKLRQSLENSIGAIAATVEMRDPYTAGHEKRVADLATAIATEMGLPAAMVEGIHFGSLIHDLGKIRVPAEILSKPTKLLPVEFELIKAHPQSGYDIIKDIDFPWPAAQMVLQHHERLDGSGYPQGLKGDAILLEARVLAVADTVEAMSSHRPYRAGLGIDKALAEIDRGRGSIYDGLVVDACLRLFRERGFNLDKASTWIASPTAGNNS